MRLWAETMSENDGTGIGIDPNILSNLIKKEQNKYLCETPCNLCLRVLVLIE